MKLEYKQDFEEARKRWDAFWNQEIIDRPCTVLCADKPGSSTRHPYSVEPVTGDFQEAVKRFDKYLETHAFLAECMPAFRPGFGPDQMAGFLGAPIVMSQESSNTSWSKKIVDDWEPFLPLKIDENNACWKRMKEFHVIAENHFKGKCLLHEIDLHSNIDTLEGLRGAQNLIFDMIDKPDIVLEAMAQVRSIYKQVYEQFQKYGNKKELGTTCSLPFYSRRKFNRLQADFICLLGPDMFRKFVLQAIQEEAQYLDYCCFHLDGPGALNHLDDILAVREIDAVQWVPGAGNKSQIEWPEVLHKIQDAGKAIILHLSAEEVKQVHTEYRPELLVYDVHAESEDQGLELLDWLGKNT